MRVFPSDMRSVFGTLALALALALPAGAQQSIVSKTVTFGSARAALALELSAGSTVSIDFANGEVRIGGETVGSYGSGDSLESAWRSLLAVAAALDDSALRDALIGWAPPSGLGSDAARVARQIDETFETSFTADAPIGAAAVPAPVVAGTSEASAPEVPENYESVMVGDAVQDGISGRTLGSLLLRLDLLRNLSGELDGFDAEGMRVLIGEDLRVESGTEIGAPLVMIDGDLDVSGLISHDLIAISSQIRLLDGGRITGRLHLADSELLEEGGVFSGEINRIDIDTEDLSRAIRADVRDVRAETRDRGFLSAPFAMFGNAGRALSGILGNLMMLLILGIAGGAVVHFAPANLDAVAESARRTPGRALTVGMAGSFMILPAYVLGIVGLAISIIGIPGLLLWVPFFPVAVMLAIGLGYVAIARNVGTWVARQKLPRMGWVRVTNAHTLIFGGLIVLLAPYMLANLLHIAGGWFGGLRTLLGVVGVIGNSIAALIGFGAVLTTRAGRKPEFWAEDDLFSPRPERPRRRRSAKRGWDASGFEASTGPATAGSDQNHAPAVEVEIEVEVATDDPAAAEAPEQAAPSKKSSTKKSTTKKASTKKADADARTGDADTSEED